MGGREAGGVGGLLRLFCCRRLKNCKLAVKHRVKTCLVLVRDNVTHSVIFTPRGSSETLIDNSQICDHIHGIHY